MISLSVLKQLQDDGFGTIDTDLFFEEAPLDSKGNPKDCTWLVTRGSSISRTNVEIQSFDLYTRYTNKTKGYKILDAVLRWLQEAYSDVCTLPAYPPASTQTYKNVRIFPTSSIESAGFDENNKLVRVISFEVYYNKGE